MGAVTRLGGVDRCGENGPDRGTEYIGTGLPERIYGGSIPAWGHSGILRFLAWRRAKRGLR